MFVGLRDVSMRFGGKQVLDDPSVVVGSGRRSAGAGCGPSLSPPGATMRTGGQQQAILVEQTPVHGCRQLSPIYKRAVSVSLESPSFCNEKPR
jgi:hypothetical protein